MAYVVPAQPPGPPVGELRRLVQEQLPGYMVPAVFVRLEALPRTPNGKVDRQALPTPGKGRPDLVTTFVAPRTPLEEGLADIWATVLGLERVGVHDNFFELGGHSLLATQVMARVRNALQFEVPLRTLFEAPTIAELGTAIEEIVLQEIDGLPAG